MSYDTQLREDLPQELEPRQGDRAHQDHDGRTPHLTRAGAQAPAWLILGFVAALSAIKLGLALWAGFDDDEAYTLVLSRQLALSYFDHPPLHQWLLNGFVRLFGEGHFDRLPFWAMQVATNLPLYGLARRIFGRDAALWTLLAYNCALWFVTSPDGLILPDTPMLLMLATGAWAVGEILFAPDMPQRRRTWLWLAAGAAFGLAGLSKYSAALTAFGVFAFLLFSPEKRRRLYDWRPFAATALALAIVSPVHIWNAEHDWISFSFQSRRALSKAGGEAAPAMFLEMLAAQIMVLSPWIAAPTALGVWQALRRPDIEAGAGFLLCLAAPTFGLFALLPLVGERPIPHWFDSAWLFIFPFAGAWFAGRGPAEARRWAAACIALTATTLALYTVALTTGLAPWLPAGAPRFFDPTAYSFDWPGPEPTSAWTHGGKPPGFVLVEGWRVGGRIGAALGPETPVCGFDGDPRGLAFACDPQALVGRDALIIASEGTATNLIARARPWFDAIEPSEVFAFGRLGRVEHRLIVARAIRLKAPYPLPYGLRRR